MKYIMMILCSLSLIGCGTIGGAVDGAGDDLNAAGKYIKEIGKEDVTLFGKDRRWIKH